MLGVLALVIGAIFAQEVNDRPIIGILTIPGGGMDFSRADHIPKSYVSWAQSGGA
jgi:hypothetical protein